MSNMLKLREIWDPILKKIKEAINEDKIYDVFLNDSYLFAVNRDELIVVVSSALAASILSDRYSDLINGVVRENLQSDFKVIFKTEEDAKKDEQNVEIKRVNSAPKNNFFANLHLNANQTFDSFVIGPSNKESSQAALLIAANPGKMFNPLFIYSNSGLGKTHLLHAIGNYVKSNFFDKKVLYLPAVEFFEEYKNFIRGEQLGEDLSSYFKNQVDVLLIDDIQFLSGKTKCAETFFTIFQGMISAGKQVIIASDKHPDKLQDLEQRLVTRFKQGLTVEIKSPDFLTCKDILKSKIQSTELDLAYFDDDVLELIANRFSSSVRDLEGALNRLVFYTTSINQVKQISLEVAYQALQSELNIKDTKNQLTMNRIVETVADYYNLSANQILGKSRTSQVALPRHISMFLIREILDVSFTKIGILFGGKDHSTVMSAVEKVRKQLKTDTSLQTVITQIKDRLKS